MLRKILFWAVVAFLIFFAAFRPEPAAETFKVIGGWAILIIEGLADFFTSLVT